MLRIYNIKYIDFMGYKLVKKQISYHHLIIPKRLGGKETVENGAILNQSTSHEYLHRIEGVDYDVFLAITSEMIDENLKGCLDVENLKRIADILRSFEREYCSYRYNSGKLLIKKQYIEDRVYKGR